VTHSSQVPHPQSRCSVLVKTMTAAMVVATMTAVDAAAREASGKAMIGETVGVAVGASDALKSGAETMTERTGVAAETIAVMMTGVAAERSGMAKKLVNQRHKRHAPPAKAAAVALPQWRNE